MTSSPPLQFAPGQFYRTRDGRKAIVYAVYPESDSTKYPIHGAVWNSGGVPSASIWQSDGRCYSLDHPSDLIAPWTDPIEFDVTVAPPWAEHVSWSHSGYWEMTSDLYYNGNNSIAIPPNWSPKNADKSKTYRIDRSSGKLVAL